MEERVCGVLELIMIEKGSSHGIILDVRSYNVMTITDQEEHVVCHGVS